MKIGILTFHRAHNYGAVLQAFALQEYLRTRGYDVEIIDYRQPYIEKVYKCFSLKRCISKNPLVCLLKLKNELNLYTKRRQKKLYFKRFRCKYLKISDRPVYNIKEIPQTFDIYLHGSDQIWNKKLLGGYDMIYFGGYKTHKFSLKASYAASFEDKEIEDRDKLLFKRGLSLLDYVSVREEKLIDRIQPLTTKKIVSVIDPTLLAPIDIWNNMIHPVNDKHYLLTYVVGIKNKEKVRDCAYFIHKKTGLPIVSVNELSPSPEDFVSYIKFADYIISDSFHATVFSILYEKDFYTVASGTSSDVRFTELLKALSIEDRIIRGQIDNLFGIDYVERKIKYKLDSYRKESVQFINYILDNHEKNQAN